MSTTETPEGIVVQRFLRRCNSRFAGLTKRWRIKTQYGLFFRAAIVVRLDDGRFVRGYITNAYETTTEAKEKAKANGAPQVGDRVRITCPVAQRQLWNSVENKSRLSSTWYPATPRGFILFESLTVPTTT